MALAMMTPSVGDHARMKRRTAMTAFAALAAHQSARALSLWPEQGLINPCLGTDLAGEAGVANLVSQAWDGLDPAQVWDGHVHLFGNDEGHSPPQAGIAAGKGWRRLLQAAQQAFFLNAACVGEGRLDAGYQARLAACMAALPLGAKAVVLALDQAYDLHGEVDSAKTPLWVGNDFVHALAQAMPQRFEWVASVHPYRRDAVVELERVAALGARAIKWIPASQGMAPDSPRCDAFYAALVRLKLPLLSHGGDERALPGDDELGNPLRLARALDHGVKVIVAHAATMGSCRDLDRGGSAPCFDLFERMMAQPRWVGLLLGDLSALTQAARAEPYLDRVIAHASEGGDWAGRLVNGSDYPLPGIMPLYAPARLADLGLLDAAAVAPLSAIRRHNAILFDFVLKRHVRRDGRRLARSVFETRRFFETAL
jgi:mannonate dehydratase